MGLARVFAAAFAAATLVLGAAGAGGVVTHDLLHDTPRTRELLKEELGSSALTPREEFAPAALAGAAAPAAERAAPGRDRFETIWQARENYLQIGESEKAEQQLALLVQTAQERGVRNLPEYGTVLVREASRRMRTGNWEQAAQVLGWARRLAPDELPVYATGALMALRRNPFNVMPVWDELAAGARAVKRSFRLQVWLRANLLGALVAGLSVFFAVSLAVLGAVVAPRFAHDLRESIGFGSPRARLILSWGALALPALLGLSPWWWVILAGLLLWPYFTLQARVLTALGAVFLSSLPLLTRERATLLTLSERPLLSAVAQAREGNWTAADYEILTAEADHGSAGLAGVTALGLTARHLGRLDEAEAAVRAALQAAPGDPVLWNNLGTVAFERKDVEGAIGSYAKAVELNPKFFAARRNLALAYREGFKFAEGEAETRRAGELDPAAAAFYAELDASSPKGITVDGLPATRELWALARAGGDEQEAASEHLWHSLMLGAPIGAWPVVLGAMLLLGAGLGAWRLKRSPAHECQRCGRIFCARCQTGKRGELCSQCHHIFVKKEGVDARVRVQKMGEIKARHRLRRVRHLVCAGLAPGGGHLSAGKFWPGVLLLLPSAFIGPRVLFGAGVYRSPWSLESAAASLLTWTGVMAFAALWAVSFWLTFRFED